MKFSSSGVRLSIICILVSIAFTFQNCSSGFKIKSSQEDLSSISTDSLSIALHSEDNHCADVQPVMTVRTFSSFGAKGDGVTDDTQAVQSALNSGVTYLSGEGKHRTYVIRGTLRVTKSVSIRDATFVQGPARGSEKQNSMAQNPYSADFIRRLSVRTFLVRPDNTSGPRIRVNFFQVKIDRGWDETQGTLSDSAGIYMDHVESCLSDVEVTGNGKGQGIFIYDSKNVRLIRPWVHDMTWAPYKIPGSSREEQLNWGIVSKGWNRERIYQWHSRDQKYYNCRTPGTEDKIELSCRIQEQVIGITVINSENVEIYGAKVEKLLARFQQGQTYPYQSDGITVAGSKNVLITTDPWKKQKTEISYVWEGIDVTGMPVRNITIADAFIHDIHSFCVKFANGPHTGWVVSTRTAFCGLAGVVVGGPNFPVDGAPSEDIWIENVTASAIGLGPRMNVMGTWKGQGTIAGILVSNGSMAANQGVNVVNSRVDNLDEFGMSHYSQFGFLNEGHGARKNAISNASSSGHGEDFSGGEVERGFVHVPINWDELAGIHSQIMGCAITQKYRRYLFRHMVDAGWTRERVIADIADFKRRGIYEHCAN